MTDHQRADSLGMVQAGQEVTPFLNQLGARSVLFSRTYNTCPLCVPARTALATGKYPTRNGVVFNDWRGTRAGDHKTIHEYLADAGYEVAHIGVDHIRVRPSLRERMRFAAWIDNSDYARYLASLGIQENLSECEAFRRRVFEYQEGRLVEEKYSNTRAAVWPYPAQHFKDNYFCDQALSFLRERRKQPFAIFLYLWAPHPPLYVPEPFASVFPPKDLVLPPNVGIPAEGEPSNRRCGVPAQLAAGVSMTEWRQVWAAHLGLVKLADSGIGRVLQALEVAGRMEDTIVCFTVDHGDHLGQHAMYQKMEMYEQAIRVPWLLYLPGSQPRRFDQPVSQLDIMPTLLTLLGLEPLDDLDGISLANAITERALPPERPVFSQYSGNPTVGDIRRAVITRRYKYVFDPTDTAELYDLERDPLETKNLAADPAYAEVLAQLRGLGKQWAETHEDWVVF